MSIVLAPDDLDYLRRKADVAAARLIRQCRLPFHECEDLRQEILVDIFARLKAFDPSRGSLGAFAEIIVLHHASRLAARIRRERAVFAPVSLDDPIADEDGSTIGDTIANSDGYLALHGQLTDPIDEAERRLDLERALSCLEPTDLRLCARLINRSPNELSRDGMGARASVYRWVRELRLQLMAAGIPAAA